MIAVVCVASPASAQSVAAPRAPQGVFGAVRPDTGAKTKLDVTASLAQGYDDDVPAELGSTLDPSSLQTGGPWTMVNAAANYAWAGKRAEFGATGASNLRYFADVGETRSVGHNAGVGLTLRLPSRTTFLVNQGAAYSPTYLYDLFPTGAVTEPGSTPTTAPDYSVSTFDTYAYSTLMTLRHDFTSRVRLSFTGDYFYTDRVNETPQWQDSNAHSLGSEYSQNLGRNLMLVGAYHYRTGEFGFEGGGKTSEHGVEFGMDYTRPLSATRRATFDARLGASGADYDTVTASGLLPVRQYRATGQAGIGFEFARTWQTRAYFRRALEFVMDLPVPVFANGVGASMAGMVARRIDVLASAGYSSGASALNRNGLIFDTYTGNLRVRYAFKRSLAAYGEYIYYYYQFQGTTQLAPGFPPGLERNGVRAGLMLWMPALRR